CARYGADYEDDYDYYSFDYW
nr:immunoglobulin heavy chain junction region [Macaca mulatta]MOX60517.1 immunoglobulin heavy chain junction region [Macaca mulatta]MOX63658.1 immunoglobulin heavy chain junction region [Macaca mulatta]MOX64922.1 immunoglobulin heavy chain junction region [Macaca mulatta]MOX68334.1 immunoglobulin heavy chain junction region [Macaca mulatta]